MTDALAVAHAKLAKVIEELRESGFDIWGWDDGTIIISSTAGLDFGLATYRELYIEMPKTTTPESA